MRKETKYNKVVNFDKETNEITVLDYTFEDGPGFKGAVGSVFEPVTKERYDEVLSMDVKEIADTLINMGCELPEDCKRGRFIEWASCFDGNDKLQLFFDLSYDELWDDIRKELNLNEYSAMIFNCVGGGRCFDAKFEGNINIELSKVVREAEK